MRFVPRSSDRSTAASLLTMAALLAFVTACGQVVTGRPTPGMAPVDLEKLAYGPYATEPAEFEPDLFGYDAIYAIEARRLLGYLVSPYEVDTDFRHLQATSVGGGAFPGVRSLDAVAESSDTITAVGTTRTNGSVRSPELMALSLLQFRTEDAANQAAHTYDSAVRSEFPDRVPLAVDGYPQARASVSPDRTLSTAFIANKTYLVAVVLRVPAAEGTQSSGKIAKALELQIAAMTELTPTPGEEILDAPLDPGGIMRSTLRPAPAEHAGTGATGTFTPAAHSHFEPDAEQFPDDYAAYGVDLVAKNYATVYRTPDLARSFALQTALTRSGDGVRPLEGVPGIPDARCAHRPMAPVGSPPYTFACALVHDRYVAMVGASGIDTVPDPELHQRAAAQYALMAKN